jgi:AraC family transcriptional regulator
MFRAITGESVLQHVKRLRLERAAMYLRYTDQPVGAVALACGFETHEAFTRAFRAAYDCTPTEFRSSRRPTELPAPSDLHATTDGPAPDFRPAPDLAAGLIVREVELPALRLAYLRHTGPYESAHRVWPRLLWWCWRTGRLTRSTALYGLCYDDDDIVPPERRRYDAAVAVEPSFMGDATIQACSLPAGRYAHTSCRGGFSDYQRVSLAFTDYWLPQSGYTLREMYTLDRYHLPAEWLRNPLPLLRGALPPFDVDLYLPVAPGPFDRLIHV